MNENPTVPGILVVVWTPQEQPTRDDQRAKPYVRFQGLDHDLTNKTKLRLSKVLVADFQAKDIW